LLGDENTVTPELAQKLADAAEHEPNIEARAQFACTAKRLPANEDLPIVRALLDHDADAADPRQPLLLWWGIEAKADSDRDAVLALFRESPLWDRPIVKQDILSVSCAAMRKRGRAKICSLARRFSTCRLRPSIRKC